MSVSIEKTNGEIYVNAKPDNAPKGSLGAAGVHIKCASEEEAKQVAAVYKANEAEQNAQKVTNQGNVDLTQSTPPAGVGEKLDIKAA